MRNQTLPLNLLPPSHYILIFGASGVGKDTLADLLKHYDFYKVHPIAPLKRFMENYFHHPKGSWDTPEGKEQLLPGGQSTAGDYMVQLYHLCQQMGIHFSQPHMNQEVRAGGKKVFIALRNRHELEELVYLSPPNAHISVIELVSSRFGEHLTTDATQQSSMAYIRAQKEHDYFLVRNEGQPAEMLTQLGLTV